MKPHDKYIEVAISLPVNHTYTYSVPDSFTDFLATGKRVLVPFGRRRVTGYVFGQSGPVDTKEIKSILDVLDEQPLFPPSMVPLFRWIADYYKHPIGDVIKNALPGGLTLYDYAALSITAEGKTALRNKTVTALQRSVLMLLESGPCRLKHLNEKLNQNVPGALLQSLQRSGWIAKIRELRKASTLTRTERHVALGGKAAPMDRLSKTRKKIIEILDQQGEMPMPDLKKQIPDAARLVRALEKDGYLTIRQKRVYRDPFGETIRADTAFELNVEQQGVVARVTDRLGQGFATFLLRGVTGSGKTEVFLRLIGAALERGLQCLLLVPEIGLTPQLVGRLQARFGGHVVLKGAGTLVSSADERPTAVCSEGNPGMATAGSASSAASRLKASSFSPNTSSSAASCVSIAANNSSRTATAEAVGGWSPMAARAWSMSGRTTTSAVSRARSSRCWSCRSSRSADVRAGGQRRASNAADALRRLRHSPTSPRTSVVHSSEAASQPQFTAARAITSSATAGSSITSSKSVPVRFAARSTQILGTTGTMSGFLPSIAR